jgi:hypothetical protein
MNTIQANKYNIHFTKHVLERMQERNITKEEILKTIHNGIKINDSEIRDSNIIVIYTVSKENKMTIITTFTSKDIKLNNEEEKLWLTLYNLLNSRLETSYEETLNKFKTIEYQFNEIKTHNATFEQFLTFDDSIITSVDNSKVIVNFPPVSLLTGAIKKGKTDIINVLLTEYNLKLDICYNNPYSVIHQTFKKLELIIEDELIISLNWLMDNFEKENNLEYFKTLLLKKEYGYSLLHRSLYNGFDKLSCWLIYNSADITTTQENKTKYNETIYDLINKNKPKLKQTNNLLKKKTIKVDMSKKDISKKDISKKDVFKGNMFYLLEEE